MPQQRYGHQPHLCHLSRIGFHAAVLSRIDWRLKSSFLRRRGWQASKLIDAHSLPSIVFEVIRFVMIGGRCNFYACLSESLYVTMAWLYDDIEQS